MPGGIGAIFRQSSLLRQNEGQSYGMCTMSAILNDPIDWKRDDKLAEVPTQASMYGEVDRRWRHINTILFDGTPVDHEVRAVEESLERRRQDIISGSLTGAYDWKHDLETARFSHRFHLANLDNLKSKRTVYLAFWQKWVADTTDYFREISLGGQKTLYLLHGAVAIGSLNILAQPTRPAAQIVLAAKFAIVFSAAGILLAGFGQVMMGYFGSLLVNRIRGKLAGDLNWRKVRAFHRYVRRHAWRGRIGERALYAAVFWFGTYVCILLLMLIST